MHLDPRTPILSLWPLLALRFAPNRAELHRLRAVAKTKRDPDATLK
jgi:hypothetical protein